MPSATALDLRPMARFFKALGDETRLRIVALLSQDELCVCHIESGLDISQSNASRHLAVLRSAGVVEPRRDGTWVYYRLAPQLDEFCQVQLRAIIHAFSKQEVLQKDVERLLKTKGPTSCR